SVGVGRGGRAVGAAHNVDADLIHLIANLWLPGGRPEREAKAGWVSGGSPDEGVKARPRVLAFADRRDQPLAGSIERRAVQVGLRLEVPVEDDPADSGFGSNVVQAGSGEPVAGERLGGGSKNLLTALGPAQPSARCRGCLFAGGLAVGSHRCHGV